jgi:hypothetical protein
VRPALGLVAYGKHVGQTRELTAQARSQLEMVMWLALDGYL